MSQRVHRLPSWQNAPRRRKTLNAQRPTLNLQGLTSLFLIRVYSRVSRAYSYWRVYPGIWRFGGHGPPLQEMRRWLRLS